MQCRYFSQKEISEALKKAEEVYNEDKYIIKKN